MIYIPCFISNNQAICLLCVSRHRHKQKVMKIVILDAKHQTSTFHFPTMSAMSDATCTNLGMLCGREPF